MANYDPKKNIVTAFGVYLTGVDSIKTSQKEDNRSLKVDTDGLNHTFVTNNDRQAEIMITMSENSVSIPLLEAAILASETSGLPGTIIITNLNSGRKQVAAECMFKKVPDSELGKDAPILEYGFLTPEIKGNVL
jgi:hypothetical protein